MEIALVVKNIIYNGDSLSCKKYNLQRGQP